MKYCVEIKADLNIQDSKGRTAIFHSPNIETIKLFIENKADLNMKNEYQETPIHSIFKIVGEQNDTSTEDFRFLCSLISSVDFMSKNKNDDTPLHHLAEKKEGFRLMKILFSNVDLNAHFLSVNAPNKSGTTPLHILCNNISISGVDELEEFIIYMFCVGGSFTSAFDRYDCTPKMNLFNNHPSFSNDIQAIFHQIQFSDDIWSINRNHMFTKEIHHKINLFLLSIKAKSKLVNLKIPKYLLHLIIKFFVANFLRNKK